ncbi:hypothetical protein GCM10007416_20330 [Kroppenstedtia guangzhouensis]|uniref:LPXTG-motif cell wall anchor domain-containing protein n=1 Tax=Kroppenstedtia guangzhouensis TaxID=1274356 RepID=A0ABQ1GMZ8_9BACL|nr:hypothetical protein [Kroppenstedtia guangzhouensis]GGA47077.1 hypothetical protein GCM10007416_20330 [Kroppenstedtia guangzhouensis]
MKKNMKKVIPVATVTLGMVAAGGTAAVFANPDGTPASDLPAQVETPEVKSVPVEEAPQSEVEPTPEEKPQPEPRVQAEVGGQVEEKPKAVEKPAQEPPKQELRSPARSEEKASSQQTPPSSASKSESGANGATGDVSKSAMKPAGEKPVNVSEEKQVAASDSERKEEKGAPNGEKSKGEKADAGTTEEEAKRTPETQDGGKMPKTAAPGPLATLMGAGLMVGGAVVKRFRFRRG